VHDWLLRDQPYTAEELQSAAAEDAAVMHAVGLQPDTEAFIARRSGLARWGLRLDETRFAARGLESPPAPNFEEIDRQRAENGAPPLTASQRRDATDRHRRSVNDLALVNSNQFRLAQLLAKNQGFRYLGGLPSQPHVTDIVLKADAENLWLLNKGSGSVLSRIPFATILAANAVSERMPLGWYGLAFGNIISFAQPTITTGGWIITYSQQAQVTQLAIGARRVGFFGRTQTEEFFQIATLYLNERVDSAARLAEAEMGPIAYARELGFTVDEVAHLETDQTEPDDLEPEGREKTSEIGTTTVTADVRPYHGPRTFVQGRETAAQVRSARDAGVQLRDILIVGTGDAVLHAATLLVDRSGRLHEFPVADDRRAPADLAELAVELSRQDVLWIPNLDTFPHDCVSVLAELVDQRAMTLSIGPSNLERTARIEAEPFTLVACGPSGTVPSILAAHWDVQITAEEVSRI
jgi:hypothetical protein